MAISKKDRQEVETLIASGQMMREQNDMLREQIQLLKTEIAAVAAARKK